ncbi:MAG: hypothetical protein WCV90_00925 [Candidatus Woesearchaeota archaeon]
MTSKIFTTLEQFLPPRGRNAVTDSETFRRVQADLEYFERYITDPQVPDLVGMINQIILTQAEAIPNARLSVLSPYSACKTLAITENGKHRGPVVFVGDMEASASIGVISGIYRDKHFSGPTIHINPFGYNRGDWRQLKRKGVFIEGYRLPVGIVQTVLENFTKVEAGDRNEVMLRLAASQEVTECYPSDDWVNIYRRAIKRDGTTHPGIDENAVHTIERRSGAVEVFGNVHGYHQVQDYSLSLRVARGTEFKVPSRR